MSRNNTTIDGHYLILISLHHRDIKIAEFYFKKYLVNCDDIFVYLSLGNPDLVLLVKSETAFKDKVIPFLSKIKLYPGYSGFVRSGWTKLYICKLTNRLKSSSSNNQYLFADLVLIRPNTKIAFSESNNYSSYNNIFNDNNLSVYQTDALMCELAKEHPKYDWNKNAGYLTDQHSMAISKYGLTKYHRKNWNIVPNEERKKECTKRLANPFCLEDSLKEKLRQLKNSE